MTLVLVPLTVGGFFFASDRTQLVGTRVWADRPILLRDVPIVNQFSDGSPSQGMEALVDELLITDTFTDPVLASVMPGFDLLPAARRQAAGKDLRTRLRVASDGRHVVTFEYRTAQPTFGIALLDSLLAQIRRSIEDIQGHQASSEAKVTASQLAASQVMLQADLSRLHDYVGKNGGDPLALRGDPTYTTLAASAQSKSDAYQSLEALERESQLANASLPQLSAALFRVVDPPATVPVPITAKTPFIHYGEIAVVGITIVELLFIYVVALRDPRIRTTDELAREHLIDLGGGPVFGQRA